MSFTDRRCVTGLIKRQTLAYSHCFYMQIRISSPWQHELNPILVLEFTDVPLCSSPPIRSFSVTASSDEDIEEWKPPEPKPRALTKTGRDQTAGEKKAPAKRTAKPKEPKEPKPPKAPKLPKEPKPRVPRKPAPERKTQAVKVQKGSGARGLAGTKRKKSDEDEKPGEDKGEKQTGCPEVETAEESGPSIRMKEEVRVYLHTHAQ